MLVVRTASKELALLQEIFEHEIPMRFTTDLERLTVLDAFIQFAQNPTSMSAGYGIEENYPFIEKNLLERYGSSVNTNAVISFLKKSVNRMQKMNWDIYLWREAITDYIKDKYYRDFIDWYASLYNEMNDDEKSKFLFLLFALHHIGSLWPYELKGLYEWYACFFDEKDDVKYLLVSFGLANALYYRSTRGQTEIVLEPTIFLEDLVRKFKDECPIKERQVEEYINSLTLTDLKLLEACSSKFIPVLAGKITQIQYPIVGTRRSQFAISPLVLSETRELIKMRRLKLIENWKKELDELLNSLIIELYPCAELEMVLEEEGAFCWRIRYTESHLLEMGMINVAIILLPYIFNVQPHLTILDKIRETIPSQLNIVFLIKETLPTIIDSFRDVGQRNLILLFDEKSGKFYVIEKSKRLSESEELLINSFLSKFLPVIRDKLRVDLTLKAYLDNLLYFNTFPRLITIRNRIPILELRLRRSIRSMLSRAFGGKWIEKVRERLPHLSRKLERTASRRPDRKIVKDLLDGATLGELIMVLREFRRELNVDELGLKILDSITQYRKILEHPIEDIKNDIDEKVYKTLNLALDYIENVICSD